MTVLDWLQAVLLTFGVALPGATVAPVPAPAEVRWVETLPRAQDRIAEVVAGCESGGRNVPNATGASTASGYWQFLDGTWAWVIGLEGPAMDWPRRTQRAAFDALWDGGDGQHHWEASARCWRPVLEAEGLL